MQVVTGALGCARRDDGRHVQVADAIQMVHFYSWRGPAVVLLVSGAYSEPRARC
jgi:hypothetical protein